jgi:hypothetical protein
MVSFIFFNDALCFDRKSLFCKATLGGHQRLPSEFSLQYFPQVDAQRCAVIDKHDWPTWTISVPPPYSLCRDWKVLELNKNVTFHILQFRPFDSFLFGWIKNCLFDKFSETKDDLLAQAKDITPSISRNVRIKVFKEWIERLSTLSEKKGRICPRKNILIF